MGDAGGIFWRRGRMVQIDTMKDMMITQARFDDVETHWRWEEENRKFGLGKNLIKDFSFI